MMETRFAEVFGVKIDLIVVKFDENLINLGDTIIFDMFLSEVSFVVNEKQGNEWYG